MIEILLVDIDVDLLTLLAIFLEQAGYSVITVSSGWAALAVLAERPIDLVVLDVMLPDLGASEVLSKIRARFAVAVVMLTAWGTVADRVKFLLEGADDYIAKPCVPLELEARIQAILRRSSVKTPDKISVDTMIFDSLQISSSARTVTVQGQGLALTSIEFNILELLVHHAGKIVNKDEISRKVLLRPSTPFNRGVDVQISKLRQKLGSRSDGLSWIQTVRGHGYQFSPLI